MRVPAVSSSLASIAVLLFVVHPASARPRAPRACAEEIGRQAARQLVRDCRESSPAAAALCRPETPCEAMRQMIVEACRNPGSETRPVCRDHDDEDDDDEDDE